MAWAKDFYNKYFLPLLKPHQSVEKQPSDESEQTMEQAMVDDRAEQAAAQVEQTAVHIASDQAGEEETGEVAVPSRQRCAESDRAEEADEFEQQVDAVAEFQLWSMSELRRQGHSAGTVSAIESRIRQLGWSSRKNSLQVLDPIWTHNPRSLFRMTNWRRLIKVADKGPGRTGPAEAIPPTTTRDQGGAKEGETVIRSDSEGSDASAVIAVGLRQQTTADGEEHERLLSLYHAVAAALELPGSSPRTHRVWGLRVSYSQRETAWPLRVKSIQLNGQCDGLAGRL